VKYSGIDAVPGDQVYWSLPQMPWLATFLTVRTSGDVNVASTLRQAVASIDRTIAVSAIRSLDSILSTATAPARFRTMLIATFALLGLTIAVMGLYGRVGYSVSQRTAELGVRLAIGAATGVMFMVLREGLALALAGLGVGIPFAYASSRTLAGMLFGVAQTDT
jgi:ABC-type antimicrobial peptide transport system permease subunit